jgi:hypothetical protein
MGNGHGRGLVQAQEIGDDALKGGQRFRRLQVADVLADEHLAVNAQG